MVARAASTSLCGCGEYSNAEIMKRRLVLPRPAASSPGAGCAMTAAFATTPVDIGDKVIQ